MLIITQEVKRFKCECVLLEIKPQTYRERVRISLFLQWNTNQKERFCFQPPPLHFQYPVICLKAT